MDARRMYFPARLGVLPWFIGLVCTASIPALGVSAQSADALPTSIASCDRGDIPSCTRAGMMLSDVDSAAYDAFLSLRFLQKACAAFDGAACGRLSLIYFAGEGEVDPDIAAASNYASRACAERDRDGCDVAEAIFADPQSAKFDAENALRYRKVNCEFGRWTSCEQLARIYFNIGDYRNAEQVATFACVPASEDRKPVCELSGALKSRRLKFQQAEAQRRADENNRQIAAQQQKRAIIDSFLRSRDYDGAVYAAVYNSRTTEDAAYALGAAHRAGAMGSIYADLLHILDYWLPSGELNRVVNAELRSRARANDCGIFNCTNMPGAAQKRWETQNGSRSSYRSSPRSSGSSSGPSPPSSADINRQVREKYRYAHCTMNNNANRSLCN